MPKRIKKYFVFLSRAVIKDKISRYIFLTPTVYFPACGADFIFECLYIPALRLWFRLLCFCPRVFPSSSRYRPFVLLRLCARLYFVRLVPCPSLRCPAVTRAACSGASCAVLLFAALRLWVESVPTCVL